VFVVALVIIIAALKFMSIIKEEVASASGRRPLPAQVKILDEFKGTASAYNALPEQTSGDPTIMASGKKVYDGAVAMTCLPFGTTIQIDIFDEKRFTVEDRGGFGCNHVDIFMWDYNDAIYFGRRSVVIRVLKPYLPRTLDEIMK
jgi:3D (Asp-Asp-Asp) domain-containing protein